MPRKYCRWINKKSLTSYEYHTHCDNHLDIKFSYKDLGFKYCPYCKCEIKEQENGTT